MPGGSNDELRPLYIRDPTLARDQSPDPRRHSQGTLQVDLVALSRNVLLLIELKPRYSSEDKEKLEYILGDRRHDLNLACREQLGLQIDELDVHPALGFERTEVLPERPQNFMFFLVSEDGLVQEVGTIVQ
jgi:hypothetical protein